MRTNGGSRKNLHTRMQHGDHAVGFGQAACNMSRLYACMLLAASYMLPAMLSALAMYVW